jgi:pSer/pThr/pTyr-binding forkhead associated (FHA) protein
VITRSRTISRKHCAIVQVNDSLLLRDLGSTNGVRVNGKRVKKEARFTAGDTVTFGDIEYNVKKIKTVEPEKRPNRDHPQDARAGGAIPLRAEASRSVSPPQSDELPVAISEDASFDSEGDTPDSMAEISPRQPSKSHAPGRSARRSEADDESIPLSE